MFHDGSDETPCLIAYVVLAGQYDTAQLRTYLAGLLPEYMVPAWVVQVDKLPKNPRSKVDRKALPKPDLHQGKNTVCIPRNDIEKQLLTLWREVLPVDTIGVYDSFFDLGGDSLLAAKLMMRLDRQFDVALTTASLFKSPSIASLAELIERQRTANNTVKTRFSVPKTIATCNSVGVSNEHPASKSQQDSTKPIACSPSYSYQSLEKQILNGGLPRVDAAAIGYVPNRVLTLFNGDSDAAINAWCQNQVIVRTITASSMGRIAAITIPMVQAQLYQPPPHGPREGSLRGSAWLGDGRRPARPW